jgi:outer membrane receptor protein involved in Fe transport
VNRVFSTPDVGRSLLSQTRRARALSPGSNVVLGSEGGFRATTDAGDLLSRSRGASGISGQRRSPIVSDVRIRGDRAARLLASGSYWFPARQDLDTALSKIDSRIVEDMIVIKGPYSVRYGPGFDFVDFQLLETPRYDCYQSHGSTSAEYKTNGEQVYGRTSVWGGASNWGYRVGYGHRTGNDYNTGGAANGTFFQPTSVPSSYNSRDFDVALGFDIDPDSSLEFHYLRLDQTGVEFPGLVFDINALMTDGFDLTYVKVDQPTYDRFEVEGWYNQTRFHGDTLGLGKNVQIPSLQTQLRPAGFFVPGYAFTNVEASSTGTRSAFTWGDEFSDQFTVGADVTVVQQELNDVEDPLGLGFLFFAGPSNHPIPPSHSTDVGLFADRSWQASDRLTLNAGARVDFISTDADNVVPNLRGNVFPFPPITVSALKQAGLDQSFTPWSVYTNGEYEVDCNTTWNAGVGYGERPPTLTELYASGSFIGSVHPGLNALEGDPELQSERRLQADLGWSTEQGPCNVSVNGYYACIWDFITYDSLDTAAPGVGFPFTPGVDFQRLAYTNTNFATLAGFELLGDALLTEGLTAYGIVNYVEGVDRSRNAPSRIGTIFRPTIGIPAGTPRSGVVGPNHEALPGITPLEAIVGLRLHERSSNPTWGAELEAVIVNDENRVASSLFEFTTPGYTIWNIRGFWQARENVTVIAGVENLGDKFYRQHLDFRPGRGVFQPGFNAYVSTEVTY